MSIIHRGLRIVVAEDRELPEPVLEPSQKNMSDDFDAVFLAASKLAKRRIEVPGTSDRFHVFTMSDYSVDAEKVRLLFLTKGIGFVEYQLDIDDGAVFHWDYVALRAFGYNEVNEKPWDGSTSCETNGIDPMVVPTLVDLQERNVIVDVNKILQYLDDGPVQEDHLRTVDRLPIAAYLYRGDPDNDRRPAHLRLFSMVGRRIVETGVLKMKKDAPDHFQSLYDFKLKKVRRYWRTSRDTIRGFVQDLYRALNWLDNELVTTSSFSELTDVVWFPALLRLVAFGVALPPRVDAYFQTLLKRPSCIAAAFDYAAILPSYHLDKIILQARGPKALRKMQAQARFHFLIILFLAVALHPLFSSSILLAVLLALALGCRFPSSQFVSKQFKW